MNVRNTSRRSGRRIGDRLRNERGSILALVVLLLIVFLGLCALAIDLGILMVARGEAQRAADAAAHAGAAYLFRNDDATEDEIKNAAIQAGEQNLVRGGLVSITGTDVEVLWDEEKVRARVYRTEDRENPVGTLFARVLGIGQVGVSASAAAELWPADAAQCVWPFAVPDKWCTEESLADGTCPFGAYSDALDGTETWEDGDWYTSWQEADANGYWTGYADDDYGKLMLIKPQSPSGSLQPGWYFPFDVGSGAASYRDAISGCTSGDLEFRIGGTLETENGNMVGPTEQGFNDLLTEYPDAWWNPTLKCDDAGNPACGGTDGNPEHIDARTRPIVLFDPEFPPEMGKNPFEIGGFASAFFDDFDSDGNVQVYFVELTGLTPASTKTDGSDNPQLKIIRIVE